MTTTMTTQNLVVNGDAETGTQTTDFSGVNAPSHWTTIGNFNEEAYSAGGSGDINTASSAAIGGGNGYFTGGPSAATSSATQTIDISAYASAIDAGGISIDASGDFGGYQSQNDSMTMTVTFLASDQLTALGSLTVGGVTAADRGDVTEMLYREADDAVPTGTRFLRVELDATRTDGDYNDGYADNIAVMLTGASVPGGAVQVSATHNFAADAIAAASGVVFHTAAAAIATFSAAEFVAGKISPSGTITGDANANTLVVALGPSHAFSAAALKFHGWSAAVDRFLINGSSADDTINDSTTNDRITAGAGNDTIGLSRGGDDVANGGDGNDTFVMGGALTALDRIDGAAGTNTLQLNGDYSTGLVFAAATIQNIQTIAVVAGHSYKLTTLDANVAAGQTLTVNGALLGAGDKLTFSGVHESDGHLHLNGGAGADVLTGGAQSDVIKGGGGADLLNGAAGADTFTYGAVSDSTSTGHDNIVGFDALADKINIAALGITFAGVDAAVTSGTLTANFDATLAAAIGAAQLDPHHAVLFSPSAGGFAGHSFVIVDINGTAGYQAGQDLVIEITTGAHLTSFGSANIVG